jgi:hypothetical protein
MQRRRLAIHKVSAKGFFNLLSAVISSCKFTGASIWNQPLCVEMSLKTTEGESLVLENWLLSVREDFDSSMM